MMTTTHPRLRVTAAIATATFAATSLAACGNDTADTGSTTATNSSTSVTTSTTNTASTERSKVTIGLTYIPNVQFSPMYVAKNSGLLPDNTTLRHHGQNEGLFTALLAGKENIVIAGADEAAAAASDKLLVVAPYYQKYPVVIIVPKDSDIHTMADLKGKKVGIPGHYGEGWYGLKAGLKQAGLTTNDIDLQEIGYTQRAALASKKVDAVVGFVNNDAVQFELSGMPVRSITPEVGALKSAAIVTTKKFAAQHPSQVKQIVAAAFKAYATLEHDPAEGVTAAESLIPELNDPEQKKAAQATMDATVALFPKDKSACKDLNHDTGIALVKTLKDIGIDGIQIDGSDLLTDKFC